MTTITVTPSTPDWFDLISRHLAQGEYAHIRFETPGLSPQQVADSIGISRQAVMRWIAEGKLSSTRRGNRHKITQDELERFRAWYIKDIADASASEALDELFGTSL